MANSIETFPFFISGARADSGIRLYQLILTSCTTRCRYGPKYTPMVSLRTSTGPMGAFNRRPGAWPYVPLSPLSAPYPPRFAEVARAACSIADPADMGLVLKLGLGASAGGGDCSLATISS